MEEGYSSQEFVENLINQHKQMEKQQSEQKQKMELMLIQKRKILYAIMKYLSRLSLLQLWLMLNIQTTTHFVILEKRKLNKLKRKQRSLRT